MLIYIKLGTISMGQYTTKKYKSISVNDIIEVKIQGKWQRVKIWHINDLTPVEYFGEYI